MLKLINLYSSLYTALYY